MTPISVSDVDFGRSDSAEDVCGVADEVCRKNFSTLSRLQSLSFGNFERRCFRIINHTGRRQIGLSWEEIGLFEHEARLVNEHKESSAFEPQPSQLAHPRF